jgi:tryptophan-rich sensory protein
MCQGAGIMAGLAISSSVSTWYLTLNKPFFNPPSWVFGPVWTLLYLLMGIGFYLIWVSKSKHKNHAIGWFIIQLALNTLWSLLFFGLKLPLLGFIDITFLWLAIVFTIIKFHKVSRNAAYLLIPYILWVSFAAILNLSIVILN